MEITREQAAYIASLAKLSFEGPELDEIALDMQDLLAFAREISLLDTSGTKPMEHVLPIFNVLRPDAAPVPFPREDVLSNAPMELDGCFTVPKVIE